MCGKKGGKKSGKKNSSSNFPGQTDKKSVIKKELLFSLILRERKCGIFPAAVAWTEKKNVFPQMAKKTLDHKVHEYTQNFLCHLQ